MSNLKYREYYQRHLPHFQPRGGTFLVNFRLVDSLPRNVIDELNAEAEELEKAVARIENLEQRIALKSRAQRRFFSKWDEALHKSQHGHSFLKDGRIADVVASAMKYHGGNWFDLEAFCIMPNHVHLVLTPRAVSESEDYSLTRIMHNIKRNSAKQANAILGRQGAFWQHENYDHYVRSEKELERIIKYVLDNPVKAGLVDEWTKWHWTYCKYDL